MSNKENSVFNVEASIVCKDGEVNVKIAGDEVFVRLLHIRLIDFFNSFEIGIDDLN